jgi:hypothetical protein
MAKLTTHNGQGMVNRDDGAGWVELSPSDYAREQIYQNHVQGLSPGQRALTGAGKYISDTYSGASELLGGPENAREQQQGRADLQQRYQSMDDYGGIAPTVGAFGAGAASAFIPGKLPAQMGIGALQGAAENPDSPWTGAGLGAGFTAAGDYLMNAMGRMGRQLTGKRTDLVNEADAASIARGEAEGLKFTPGQKTGDRSRRIMEKQLAKNPRTAGLDMDRFLDNQALLNDAAARTLDLPATGRVTGTMRGQAAKSVGDAFDAVAEESAPVMLLGRDFIAEADNLTAEGGALLDRYIKKFPNAFKGEPIDGKQFNQMRNWLAEQTRRGPNIRSGAADEMQPFLRIMDDSLEAANVDSNPMLVDRIRRARTKWKSLLVIENAQRGAESAASGNISPTSAYQALRKYDKGGIFRGNHRDPFSTIVDAMAAAGDTAPPPMPSQGGGRSITQSLMDQLYTGPAAEAYMEGSPIGEILLGVMADSAKVPGMGKAGQAGARGLMAADDDDQPIR